jgi:hypothetical protein
MITPIFSMKKSLIPAFSLAALALGLCAISMTAGGMDAKPRSAASETDLMPAETAPPKSVFDLSQPYKDPFFPNSTRHHVQAATTQVVSNYDPSQYRLKGISGAPGQEVVIINNGVAAAGETVNVTLPSGAIVAVKVQKIEQHSVTILPEGQREQFTIYLPKEDW